MTTPRTPPHSPLREPCAPKSRTSNSRLSPDAMKRAQAAFQKSFQVTNVPLHIRPHSPPATPPMSPEMHATDPSDDVETFHLPRPRVAFALQPAISLKPSPSSSFMRTPPSAQPKLSRGAPFLPGTPLSAPSSPSPMPRTMAGTRLKEMTLQGQ